MVVRRFVIAGILLATSPTILAQTPSEGPPTRVTLSAMNNDSCVDLIKLAEKKPKTACVVSGTITALGQVDDVVARCEVRNFTGPARRCFSGYTLRKEHAGETGPICAALLFVPLGRDGKAVAISFKEYLPCTSLRAAE